jgi:hypothetical protein
LDSAVIDLCGSWPPSPICYNSLGNEFYFLLTSRGYKNGQHVFYNRSQSETFTVFGETGPPCAGTGGGCPFVGAVTADGFELDNNVLVDSGREERIVADSYHLRVRPAVVDSTYRLALQETAVDSSGVDAVGLSVVDHPARLMVSASRDGRLYPHDRKLPLVRAIDDQGQDVTALFSAEADSNFHGYPEDFVVLNFGPPRPEGVHFFVVSDIKQPNGSILVQELQSVGGEQRWTTVSTLIPRKEWGEDVIDGENFHFAEVDSVRIRLLWTKEHKVDYVALLPDGREEIESRRLELTNAVHSGLGAVELALARSDGNQVPLRQGDVVFLTFEAPRLRAGWVREFIFETNGWWSGEDGEAARLRGPGGTPMVTLSQVQPTPFRTRTAANLVLPETAHVAAQVFDVRGRLVQVVGEGWWRAGEHEIAWEGDTHTGAMALPGVYFLRVAVNGRPLEAEKVVRIR